MNVQFVKRSLSFIVLACLLISCDDEVNPGQDCNPKLHSDTTLKILPLGDSRVEGGSPEFESYRYTLWRNLIENSWDVDFIGSRKEEAEQAPVLGTCFDNEHEGTGGATTVDILETLTQVGDNSGVPDIVLLGIGGNDLLDGGASPEATIANIEKIIDKLQTQNPMVVIFLEQIAPGRSNFMTPANTVKLNTFNGLIPEVVQRKSNDNSMVIAVDMAVEWKDEYLADPVHYNLSGAKLVADRYFAAIELNITE
ncbi:MAG: hypothetical protein KTR30_31815 [Saprospiraceae bacterium]|nr:hypothetical protein [Saprospiraceae bacterium]